MVPHWWPLAPGSVLSAPLLLSLPIIISGLAPGVNVRDGERASDAHPMDGPDADLRVWIEAEKITAHVVLNMAFVDAFLEVPREDEMLLREPEYDVAGEMVLEFLTEQFSVTVEGKRIEPQRTGFEVLDPNFELIAHFPRFGTRAMQRLRTTLEYPLSAPPSEVELNWTAYPPDPALEGPEGTPLRELVANLTAGGQRTRVTLRESEPTFTWRGHTAAAEDLFEPVPEGPGQRALELPLAAFALAVAGATLLIPRSRGRRRRGRILAGAACVILVPATASLRVSLPHPSGGIQLPSEAQALAVFGPLHANIYRAFDFTRQSDVYDALARSVHGDLLDELYTQIHRGLVQQEEGGAVSEVQALRPLNVTVEQIDLGEDGAPAFTLVCQWQVDGAVFHWGHSHWRTNEYEARYGVTATSEGWRITSHEILGQSRVDSGPLPPGNAAPFVGESF